LNHTTKFQIKNMHDKKLSFIFLLHLINYKKFKSLKKRLLLPNFNILRSLLPSIKHYYYITHRRSLVSNTHLTSLYNYSIPTFFIKRMFGKKNLILSELDKNNILYYWQNGVVFNTFKKNRYFFKNIGISSVGGSNIYTSKFIEKSDYDNLFFLKNVVESSLNTNNSFNVNMFFNLTLINLVEIYCITTQLTLMKTLENN
jgi:hypothetical protein